MPRATALPRNGIATATARKDRKSAPICGKENYNEAGEWIYKGFCSVECSLKYKAEQEYNAVTDAMVFEYEQQLIKEHNNKCPIHKGQDKKYCFCPTNKPSEIGAWRSEAMTKVIPAPHPHEGGCECCRASKRCNYCGEPLGGAGCTNGRCKGCHGTHCTSGGSTGPGHGYGRGEV